MKVASDGEPHRLVRGDSLLPMDAENLEHIREEQEQELLDGPPSPTPASAKNDATFMGNLMSPLLTQAPGGRSASDAPLDEGNASRTSPPTVGDVNLGDDGLARVRSSMLDVLNRQAESAKCGYASSDSDVTRAG